MKTALIHHPIYLKHNTGIGHPETAMRYEVVMDALDAAPADIRFFDDSRANVEAAERLGIRAFLVDGLEGVRAALAAEELL